MASSYCFVKDTCTVTLVVITVNLQVAMICFIAIHALQGLLQIVLLLVLQDPLHSTLYSSFIDYFAGTVSHY